MYYQQYYQPQSYPVPAGQTNIIWVENIEEAKIRTRQLFPNSTMIMLDNNRSVAYRCVTDISGKAQPVEVFHLTPYEEPAEPEKEPETHQMDINEYMKQQDNRIAELEARLQSVVEETPRKRGTK